jgi:hypothetical protein
MPARNVIHTADLIATSETIIPGPNNEGLVYTLEHAQKMDDGTMAYKYMWDTYSGTMFR